MAYDVAIVGGGVAGTYAAYRLRHTYQRIGLFEASHRIGGRLFTYRLPCSPSMNLEMGGMRIFPEHHVQLCGLASELGLQLCPFPSTASTAERESQTFYYLRGKHLSEEEVHHGEIPYALSDEEKRNQHRLWRHYLEKLLSVTPSENHLKAQLGDPQLLTKTGIPLYKLTFEEALDRVATSEGKSFTNDVDLASDSMYTNTTSAAAGFRYAIGTSGETRTLADGMSALPQRLKTEFEKCSPHHATTFNQRLVSIRKTKDNCYTLQFQLTVSNSDGTYSHAEKHTKEILTRRVILALPLSALDSIQWEPFQSVPFQESRSLAASYAMAKIYLIFQSPWWRKCPTTRLGSVSEQIYTYSIDLGGKDGSYVLLASYSVCEGSNVLRALQSRGEPIKGSAPGDLRVSIALSDYILDHLASAYNIPRDDIPKPKGGVAKFWDRSPTREAVVVWKEGCFDNGVLSRIKQASKDEDVVVVGSDIAVDYGYEMWVEGALRVVDEVLASSNFISG